MSVSQLIIGLKARTREARHLKSKQRLADSKGHCSEAREFGDKAQTIEVKNHS